MLQIKCIGVGAAGGKAVIEAIKMGSVSRDQALIFNSTAKDVADEYNDIFIQFKDAVGGCGKERSVAKDLVMNSLKNESLRLETWLDPNDDLIIIAASTEGGTGSGSVPMLAKYINEVLGFKVHVYALVGFEDDVRGLQNTFNFFQELTPGVSVEATSNKKFLDGTGNRKKAEAAANSEFAERIKILQGQMIVDSDQNIDETDLDKISTKERYTQVEHIKITERIKNPDQFNQLLNDMLDDSKSLETEPTCVRLGVILNVSDKTLDHIDHSFDVLKNRLGNPFDFFKHIQYVGNEEYICVISSGMKMPIEEVKAVYDRYRVQTNSVDKARDGFFDSVSEMQSNPEDTMFDSATSYKQEKKINLKSKDAFFGESVLSKNNKKNTNDEDDIKVNIRKF